MNFVNGDLAKELKAVSETSSDGTVQISAWNVWRRGRTDLRCTSTVDLAAPASWTKRTNIVVL